MPPSSDGPDPASVDSRDCSLSIFPGSFFCEQLLLGDVGHLSSGCLGEARRSFFEGGAESSQSIWVLEESCFSKTAAESFAGRSADSATTGKSCVVAQKAASYIPKACSSVRGLSVNGEGASNGPLGCKQAKQTQLSLRRERVHYFLTFLPLFISQSF